jgi:threonine/homoserine/homoserine lactone efflux protein
MPAADTLLVFALSTLALLAIPGPSVLFVVARTVEHGRTAGLVSMLGVETGALVHVVVAAAGVSALVASSPAALTALRWAGGAYLLWLGAQALRRRRAVLSGTPGAAADHARLYRQGVLVDLLNPKTALFFLAFLPGFVEPAQGPVALQVAVLGSCFVALATITDGAYALAAARLSRRVRGSRLAAASAGTYGLLGVVALAGGV